jgi:hypothetical protein
MDLHKPKPWHSLREFLKEYLIIVVGVLTALGAEQVVETLHWRHEAELARRALAYDMRRGLGWSGEYDAEGPCIARTLAELSNVLDQAQRTHRLPPLAWRGPPRGRTWALRSWASLVSGQTLAHMSNADQHHLAGVALAMESMAKWRDDQAVQWNVLATMAGPGRPIDDAEIASLRRALFQAYLRARQTRSGARNVATLIVHTGLLPPADADAAFHQGVVEAPNTPLCRPAPTVRSPDDLLQDGLNGPVAPPGRQGEDDLGVRGRPETE